MAIFGIPFFAAGLAVILIGLGIIVPSNADEMDGWVWPALVVFGGVFAAVGGGLMFGRRWIILDRAQGRIQDAWGLVVPMKVTEHPLYSFSAIHLLHEPGDSDTAESFPVLLTGATVSKPVRLSAGRTYGEARKVGEHVAAFLGFPFLDKSTDNEIAIPIDRAINEETTAQPIVAPESLDTSPPPLLKCSVSSDNGSTVIDIPGPGFTARTVIPAVIPLLFVLFVLYQFWGPFDISDAPPPVQVMMVVFFAAFILLPLSAAVGGFLKGAFGRTRVIVNAEGIEIVELGGIRRRTKHIPRKDILGLDYGIQPTKAQVERQTTEMAQQRFQGRSEGAKQIPEGVLRMLQKLALSRGAKGITLKTRAGLLSFGEGLPDDEVKYLYHLVLRTLKSANV